MLPVYENEMGRLIGTLLKKSNDITTLVRKFIAKVPVEVEL